MANANTARRRSNVIGDWSLLACTIFLLFIVCESEGLPYRRNEQRWGPPRRPSSGRKVVFPTDRRNERRQEGTRPRGVLPPVPSCRNTTFCEKPAYYPEELVNFAVQMDDKFKYSATVDEVVDSESESRIDAMDEVPICSSIVEVVFPKTAETRDKDWLFVINHAHFTQGVRIEACREESSHILNNTPDGYETSCKQQYAYRQLATVLPDGTIKLDAFRFPSGCRGYLRFANSEIRFGRF